MIFSGAVSSATPSGLTFKGNIPNTNPLFVNPGNATIDNLTMVNAALQSGSPAIDAGMTIADVTNDYVGTARPQGSAYDIGAFESVPSPSKPLPPTDVIAIVN